MNKKTYGLKDSGVKGLRELKGLFSSINYGPTSARQSGINRNQVQISSKVTDLDSSF